VYVVITAAVEMLLRDVGPYGIIFMTAGMCTTLDYPVFLTGNLIVIDNSTGLYPMVNYLSPLDFMMNINFVRLQCCYFTICLKRAVNRCMFL
jgi:hypothetical protein